MPLAYQRKQIYKEIKETIEKSKFCKEYRGRRIWRDTSIRDIKIRGVLGFCQSSVTELLRENS